MIKREKVIESYFQSWINKTDQILQKTFNQNTIYNECYGPEYHGLEIIERWFSDWNERGTVLIWDIKQFIHQGNLSVVEWYFKCEYDGVVGEFDGVSLVEFNNDNYIVNLKEFQSKIPHYSPYN